MTYRYTVLFLCTGNSARSILGEALLRRLGGDRFTALSAGSQPSGRVHPLALEILEKKGFAVDGLRSKAWSEFGERFHQDPLDFVFTVCDSAAAETCPVWPGRPLGAHWGIPDPAAATGSPEAGRLAFEVAFGQMKARVEAFLALPSYDIDRASLQEQLREIGQI